MHGFFYITPNELTTNSLHPARTCSPGKSTSQWSTSTGEANSALREDCCVPKLQNGNGISLLEGSELMKLIEELLNWSATSSDHFYRSTEARKVLSLTPKFVEEACSTYNLLLPKRGNSNANLLRRWSGEPGDHAQFPCRGC